MTMRHQSKYNVKWKCELFRKNHKCVQLCECHVSRPEQNFVLRSSWQIYKLVDEFGTVVVNKKDNINSKANQIIQSGLTNSNIVEITSELRTTQSARTGNITSWIEEERGWHHEGSALKSVNYSRGKFCLYILPFFAARTNLISLCFRFFLRIDIFSVKIMNLNEFAGYWSYALRRFYYIGGNCDNLYSLQL